MTKGILQQEIDAQVIGEILEASGIPKEEWWITRLEEFFKAVAKLTMQHEVLISEDGEDCAVVYPSELGKLLEKVDPEWYNKVKDY